MTTLASDHFARQCGQHEVFFVGFIGQKLDDGTGSDAQVGRARALASRPDASKTTDGGPR